MNPLPPTIADVCEKALRLPCSPALLPRLIAVLEDNSSGAAEIEAVVELDSALTAATIRLANSAYFSGGLPVENVSEAVVRLGLREIYRLAALALVNRWDPGSFPVAYRGDPGDFFRHSLCTALAAEVLAETTGRVDPAMAYTAGLVCDMGKLAVAHACQPFFPAIRAYQAQHGGTWNHAERAILGYDHTQVGAELLKTWRFPQLFVVAAEFGNTPSEAPEEALPLMGHLHAAKYLATSFGPGVAEDGFLFELNEAFLVASGFTPELLMQTLPVVLERASARLGDKLSHGPVSF